MEIKSYLRNIIQYKSYTKFISIPIPLPILAAFESCNSNSNSGHLKMINSGIGPNPVNIAFICYSIFIYKLKLRSHRNDHICAQNLTQYEIFFMPPNPTPSS